MGRNLKSMAIFVFICLNGAVGSAVDMGLDTMQLGRLDELKSDVYKAIVSG